MDYENKIDIPFGAQDSELKGWEYTIPEGMEAEIKDGKVIVREKESEDERIRKELISLVRMHVSPNATCLVRGGSTTRQQAEFYLEKQKEQKSTVIIPKFRVGDFVKDTNYHGNPVYEIMHIDKECYVCQYRGDKSMGDKSVMHFALDNPYLRLVQNPAEWGEEDEKQIRQIERIVKNGATPKLQEKIHNFLYSLRPQPHWKPSKQEMDAFEVALKGEFQNGVYPASALCKLFGELKKLYYNDEIPPSWKPSEEQMDALEFACTIREGERNYYLHTLFDDLSKL